MTKTMDNGMNNFNNNFETNYPQQGMPGNGYSGGFNGNNNGYNYGNNGFNNAYDYDFQLAMEEERKRKKRRPFIIGGAIAFAVLVLIGNYAEERARYKYSYYNSHNSNYITDSNKKYSDSNKNGVDSYNKNSDSKNKTDKSVEEDKGSIEEKTLRDEDGEELKLVFVKGYTYNEASEPELFTKLHNDLMYQYSDNTFFVVEYTDKPGYVSLLGKETLIAFTNVKFKLYSNGDGDIQETDDTDVYGYEEGSKKYEYYGKYSDYEFDDTDDSEDVIQSF